MSVHAQLRAIDDPDAPPLFETGPHPDRERALAAVASHIAASAAATDTIAADDGSDTLDVRSDDGTPVARIHLED